MKAVPVLALVASLLTLATPVQAAADLKVADIGLADEEGNLLRITPGKGPVTFIVHVNNTGTTALNGTARLRINVSAEGNSTVAFTATGTVPSGLSPGNETTVNIVWSGPRDAGNYTITATIEGHQQSGFELKFSVATTPVPAGTYGDRVLQYTWLWATFVLAVVLFGVVLAARKR